MKSLTLFIKYLKQKRKNKVDVVIKVCLFMAMADNCMAQVNSRTDRAGNTQAIHDTTSQDKTGYAM